MNRLKSEEQASIPLTDRVWLTFIGRVVKHILRDPKRTTGIQTPLAQCKRELIEGVKYSLTGEKPSWINDEKSFATGKKIDDALSPLASSLRALKEHTQRAEGFRI